MSTKRDYYEVLRITKEASTDEIKIAYRNLAREYHPDVAEDKSTAEVKFREINEAFTILSNPEKRSLYDRYGHAGVDGASGGSGFNFSSGFDIFDDLLGSFFGGGTAEREASRGNDIRYDLTITLEEAFNGVKQEIDFRTHVSCETCKGSGSKSGDRDTCTVCRGAGQVREVQQSFFGRVVRATICPKCHGAGEILKDPCKTCQGTGAVEGRKKVTVEVPRGVDDGNRIRLRAEGEVGLRGRPAGDLYIFIHVKPHAHFKREELHVLYELTVSFPEAALGNEVEVPTLGGKEKIQIAAGTQNGATLRLKGKGMPSVNGMTQGDQYVVVHVDVPKKLNEKQKQLLLEYAKNAGINLQHEKGFLGKVKDALSS